MAFHQAKGLYALTLLSQYVLQLEGCEELHFDLYLSNGLAHYIHQLSLQSEEPFLLMLTNKRIST